MSDFLNSNPLNSNHTSIDSLNEQYKPPDSVEATNQLVESSVESRVERSMSETEEKWYYFGLRGNVYGRRAPRLIYRTSKDILPPPNNPHDAVRQIRLLTVHDHEKLSENNLWDTVRDETAGILDHNQIKFTSIDLVRFRVEELSPPYYTSHLGYSISSITIWIGVLPFTTTSVKVFQESSQEILKLLKHHGIEDFEIAFRESVTRPFARTSCKLYAPFEEGDPCKGLLDSLTTAISVPIVAEDSPNTSEGALGFYFKVGEDLYGVTARHVLFPPGDGNETYSEDTSYSKKYLALMSDESYRALYDTIQYKMDRLREDLERTPPAEQRERDEAQATIDGLDNCLQMLCDDWLMPKDRIIGHVVWAPPICGISPGSPSTQGYTQDVCVVKLDKDKFVPNMVGNSIDIGTLRGTSRFLTYIHPVMDVDRGVEYPPDFDMPTLSGLYRIRRILPVSKMNASNVPDPEGHPTRFVVRSGPKPETTIGLINGYMSRVRHYTLLGASFDSIEMAIFPYGLYNAPFSTPGDSGSAIVGSNNEFVAQLTSGTGSPEIYDINYATPMEWLWNSVIKPKFPGADLFFDLPPMEIF